MLERTSTAHIKDANVNENPESSIIPLDLPRIGSTNTSPMLIKRNTHYFLTLVHTGTSEILCKPLLAVDYAQKHE